MVEGGRLIGIVTERDLMRWVSSVSAELTRPVGRSEEDGSASEEAQ
ncbi:MAG: hypothetical protein ACRELC_01010 [Gemmatimonadota bacterium]